MLRAPRWKQRLAHLAMSAAPLVAGTLAAPHCATAHPHVWISVVAELQYNPGGSITGVRQTWTFDEMFSALSTRGIEQKIPGTFTREELGLLEKTYLDGLKDYEYFTFAKLGGERQKSAFADPVDDVMDYDRKQAAIKLSFTLPLRTPAPAQSLEVLIYDPQLFFYLSFDRFDPVRLIGAPTQCRPLLKTPTDDAAPAPDSIAGMVTTQSGTIWVKCL